MDDTTIRMTVATVNVSGFYIKAEDDDGQVKIPLKRLKGRKVKKGDVITVAIITGDVGARKVKSVLDVVSASNNNAVDLKGQPVEAKDENPFRDGRKKKQQSPAKTNASKKNSLKKIDTDEVVLGEVTSFNAKRGFGHITILDEEGDYMTDHEKIFFHVSNLPEDLQKERIKDMCVSLYIAHDEQGRAYAAEICKRYELEVKEDQAA